MIVNTSLFDYERSGMACALLNESCVIKANLTLSRLYDWDISDA